MPFPCFRVSKHLNTPLAADTDGWRPRLQNTYEEICYHVVRGLAGNSSRPAASVRGLLVFRHAIGVDDQRLPGRHPGHVPVHQLLSEHGSAAPANHLQPVTRGRNVSRPRLLWDHGHDFRARRRSSVLQFGFQCQSPFQRLLLTQLRLEQNRRVRHHLELRPADAGQPLHGCLGLARPRHAHLQRCHQRDLSPSHYKHLAGGR